MIRIIANADLIFSFFPCHEVKLRFSVSLEKEKAMLWRFQRRAARIEKGLRRIFPSCLFALLR